MITQKVGGMSSVDAIAKVKNEIRTNWIFGTFMLDIFLKLIISNTRYSRFFSKISVKHSNTTITLQLF